MSGLQGKVHSPTARLSLPKHKLGNHSNAVEKSAGVMELSVCTNWSHGICLRAGAELANLISV
jgi:CobQ-like glutamine amidotransferase family enzyme